VPADFSSTGRMRWYPPAGADQADAYARGVTLSPGTLRFYGQASDAEPLDWSWVDAALAAAPTYWVVVPAGGDSRHPHPRPVWGVWLAERLHLSIGSPAIARAATPGVPVSVHLDSGIDVVIVEGAVAGPTEAADVIAAYDRKYDWTYALDEYGPLTTVGPVRVLAWRSGGFAGRDGFLQSGRWASTDDPGERGG
jgi:hypothetical protein